jgi:hypothetical protein
VGHHHEDAVDAVEHQLLHAGQAIGW